jgi:hypothetical protein
MRRPTDISLGSMSTLLPVYPHYSVLVSDTFLVDATYRLSDTFLGDAIGTGDLPGKIIYYLPFLLPSFTFFPQLLLLYR